ncbi:MAG: hypothetical protein ACRDPW_09175 [Mycobacteriales bacterium]
MRSTGNVSMEGISSMLSARRIELPSWAFRGADARADAPLAAHARRVKPVSPVARGPYEVLADAAVVHHFTSSSPCVGLAFPCDATADYADIACHAAELGLAVSSLYVTVGNRGGAACDVAHSQRSVRQQAQEQLRLAVKAADELGAERVVLTLNHDARYPGQQELAARRDLLVAGLAAVYEQLPSGMSLALSQSVTGTQAWVGEPLWRQTLSICEQLGRAARLMVDTSVDRGVDTPPLSQLATSDRLAGLILPNPTLASSEFEVFSTLAEVLGAESAGAELLVTLAPTLQHHAGIAPLIGAVLAIQQLVVQVMQSDTEQLRHALLSEEIDAAGVADLVGGCSRDVSVQLAALRHELGVDADPLAAYDRACRARYQLTERRASVQRAAERRLTTRRPDRAGRAAAARFPTASRPAAAGVSHVRAGDPAVADSAA